MGDATETSIVVPCYDEAGRLPADDFVDLAGRTGAYLIFVDDGSTDATPSLLTQLAERLGAGPRSSPWNATRARARPCAGGSAGPSS